MKRRRVNAGALAQFEQWFIASNISHLSDRLTPDHLTALSVFGAFLSAASAVLLPHSQHFLELFLLGLVLNWFGDSFDGALARFRGCERPSVGLLTDKTADIFSFVVIFAGLSMSRIFTPVAAAMLVFAFLINNIYLLMRLVVEDVQIIGIDGFGATEGRLSLGVWAVLVAGFGLPLNRLTLFGAPALNAVAIGIAILVGVRVVVRVRGDVVRLSAQSGARFEERPALSGRRLAPANEEPVRSSAGRI
jgi:archaetidylinositol phosphate synthase